MFILQKNIILQKKGSFKKMKEKERNYVGRKNQWTKNRS